MNVITKPKITSPVFMIQYLKLGFLIFVMLQQHQMLRSNVTLPFKVTNGGFTIARNSLLMLHKTH